MNPDWLKKAVFYEIYPQSFQDSNDDGVGDFNGIVQRLDYLEDLGISAIWMNPCFDSSFFDAGYDIVGNLEEVLEEFDRVIGIDKLKVVHLNDSKNPLGSKKDRHEQIGKGNIGLDAISRIINNKHLKSLPFILETPQESLEGYKEEIKLLKSCFKD